MAIIVRSGVTRLSINGTPYDLRSDLRYVMNTLKREPIIGMDGGHGWTEPPCEGTISFVVTDSDGLSVKGFQAMTNVTIEIQLRTGKRIIGTQCFSIGTQETDVKDASIKLEFVSFNILEIS